MLAPNFSRYKRFDRCLNVEGHNAACWLIPDLKKDSVFVKSVYHSCDKPTFPNCFRFGWADNIGMFDYREEFWFS
jgi:hypothetical protein